MGDPYRTPALAPEPILEVPAVVSNEPARVVLYEPHPVRFERRIPSPNERVLPPGLNEPVLSAWRLLHQRVVELVVARKSFTDGEFVGELGHLLSRALEDVARVSYAKGEAAADKAADDAVAALEHLATVRRAFAILTTGAK